MEIRKIIQTARNKLVRKNQKSRFSRKEEGKKLKPLPSEFHSTKNCRRGDEGIRADVSQCEPSPPTTIPNHT